MRNNIKNAFQEKKYLSLLSHHSTHSLRDCVCCCSNQGMNDDDRNPDHKNCDMKKQSSEEEDPEAQNSKLTQKFDQGAGDGDDEQQSGQTVGKIGGDNSVAGTARMDAKASSSPQTLAMSLSTDDLQEVPVKYGLQPFESAEESKDQVTLSKKEKPKNIVDETETATVQAQKVAPDGTLTSELSPTSVTQFITSISSPAQTEQKKFSVEKRNISHLQEVGEKNSFDPKKLSIVSAQRTPSPDGYNWRKYGQKQVKSPQGSRSYYRCTHADCYAKKIECSDHSNRVMEIVYKSHHSHDPPQKVNCTRGSRLTSPIALVNGTDSSVSPTGVIADSVPSTSAVDSVHETAATPDPKQKDSSKSHDITETGAKQEQIDEPEPRKRLKKTDTSCSESPSKAMKKPKVIVHTAGDVGISGDGYRWRKYGQKMVKGNPHPRNYYRCTSAGCPVRKHIERAKENTNAAIITYKGVHDHDMPVPKKRHGPPSAPLVAAAAPTSMSTMQVVKTECAQNPESATQWSVDKEGELKGQSLECGAEKAVDATRTLLSIGFEIKP